MMADRRSSRSDLQGQGEYGRGTRAETQSLISEPVLRIFGRLAGRLADHHAGIAGCCFAKGGLQKYQGAQSADSP